MVGKGRDPSAASDLPVAADHGVRPWHVRCSQQLPDPLDRRGFTGGPDPGALGRDHLGQHEMYQKMDELVGRTMEKLDDDTAFFIMS